MPTAELASIVEGHGDAQSISVLMRRIGQTIEPGLAVQVRTVIRTPKSKLLKSGELERAVELAARKVGANGAILVLLDSDSDCPATLGPDLLRRAQAQRGNLPIAAVVAKHEFENWFIAAAVSLRSLRRLPHDLTSPADPESITSAKAWLSARMPPQSPYSETIDQAALTAQFSLAAARQSSSSFDKMYREIERLIAAVRVP